MATKLKIKVTVGIMEEFVMLADMEVINALSQAKIIGGAYVNDVYVPYLSTKKIKIEIINEFPTRHQIDVFAEKDAFEKAAADLKYRADEAELAAYNAGEL